MGGKTLGNERFPKMPSCAEGTWEYGSFLSPSALNAPLGVQVSTKPHTPLPNPGAGLGLLGFCWVFLGFFGVFSPLGPAQLRGLIWCLGPGGSPVPGGLKPTGERGDSAGLHKACLSWKKSRCKQALQRVCCRKELTTRSAPAAGTGRGFWPFLFFHSAAPPAALPGGSAVGWVGLHSVVPLAQPCLSLGCKGGGEQRLLNFPSPGQHQLRSDMTQPPPSEGNPSV